MKFLVSIALLFALAAGCSKNRSLLLTERADRYNQNVRWASPQGAATFYSKQHRRELMEKLSKALEEKSVVEYGVLDIGLDPTGKKASVLVEYSYYGADQNLKKRGELQFWEYEDNDWFITRIQDVPRGGSTK